MRLFLPVVAALGRSHHLPRLIFGEVLYGEAAVEGAPQNFVVLRIAQTLFGFLQTDRSDRARGYQVAQLGDILLHPNHLGRLLCEKSARRQNQRAEKPSHVL